MACEKKEKFKEANSGMGVKKKSNQTKKTGFQKYRKGNKAMKNKGPKEELTKNSEEIDIHRLQFEQKYNL